MKLQNGASLKLHRKRTPTGSQEATVMEFQKKKDRLGGTKNGRVIMPPSRPIPPIREV
jgi:hypothetical protein